MDDANLLRYSRQILLPGIDVAGQMKLMQSRVLILGLGGLGSPAALYLAAAGIGELWLADGDTVDLSNLQRQIIHDETQLGRNKAESAALRIQALNSAVRLRVLPEHAEASRLASWLPDVDLVLDCTDTFASRFLINGACLMARKPLLSAAAIRFEGQLYLFDPHQSDSPCYACLYPPHLVQNETDTCSRNGVLGPLVGTLGSLQALEAVKYLCGLGAPLAGHMLIVDALRQEWRRIRLARDPHCPVCASPVA